MTKQAIADLFKLANKTGRYVYCTPKGAEYNLRLSGVRVRLGAVQVRLQRSGIWENLPVGCPVFVQ